ncbi:MAG: purine-nucleoside phosphorylase [Bacteroidetes bacterium]|nr:MAG: purine-nucleoside phosphorylase [Bacteroidota bacterium]
MLTAIKEAVSYIRERIPESPDTAIILGSGLGKIVDQLEVEHVVDYESIPHFPVSTVEGHEGLLISGLLGEKRVLVMQGRFHFYEGYEMQEVIFPIRVMKFLGIKTLVVSNAAGGMNPDFEIGDIMVINDHISLMPNPLLGKHTPEFGARFPDMSQTYDPILLQKARTLSQELQIPIQEGCYVGVSGPTLETPKEYQYMRIIGGDAVGMSTVPEAIAAHQMGIRIFAVSVITDLGVPGKIKKLTHKDVIEAAEKTAPKLTELIINLITD